VPPPLRLRLRGPQLVLLPLLPLAMEALVGTPEPQGAFQGEEGRQGGHPFDRSRARWRARLRRGFEVAQWFWRRPRGLAKAVEGEAPGGRGAGSSLAVGRRASRRSRGRKGGWRRERGSRCRGELPVQAVWQQRGQVGWEGVGRRRAQVRKSRAPPWGAARSTPGSCGRARRCGTPRGIGRSASMRFRDRERDREREREREREEGEGEGGWRGNEGGRPPSPGGLSVHPGGRLSAMATPSGGA